MGLVSRGIYRTRQAWRTLRARPLAPQAKREITQVITDEQMRLFESQSDAGQQHGYRVMKTLLNAGYSEKDLLTAALLHDVGKARQKYTWLDRVKVVLTQRVAPQLAAKWSNESVNFWTRAYVVKAYHAEWGAEAVADTGGSELCIALVRSHQDAIPADDEDSDECRLLALLQWADDQN